MKVEPKSSNATPQELKETAKRETKVTKKEIALESHLVT